MIDVGGETVRATEPVSLSFGVAVHDTCAEYIGSNPRRGLQTERPVAHANQAG